MKKMDEIMELLTEEIDGFNTSIERLQELKDSLDNIRVVADSTFIEVYIQSFLKEQQKRQDAQERLIRELHKSLKSNYYLPKSFAIAFLVITYFALFGMGFIILENYSHEREILAVRKMDRQEVISEMEAYFRKHPDSLKP